MRYLRFPRIYFSLALVTFLWFFAYHAPLMAKPTILIMGDSLSAAYQMHQDAGWGSLLESKLKKDFPKATVINSSIVGETTGGGLARLPALLNTFHPDIVLLELGGNDGLRGLPTLRIKANLQKMIALCLSQNIKVILIGMRLPPNYGVKYTQAFAKNYVELSKAFSIPLIPFFLENVALQPGLMLEDRIHPTQEAQVILLDNIWPTLAPLLTPFKNK